MNRTSRKTDKREKLMADTPTTDIADVSRAIDRELKRTGAQRDW
jgi:hypothetical protein